MLHVLKKLNRFLVRLESQFRNLKPDFLSIALDKHKSLDRRRF